jgi:hypothetical protein
LPSWLEWLEVKGIGSDTPIRHFQTLGWLKDRPHIAEKYFQIFFILLLTRLASVIEL